MLGIYVCTLKDIPASDLRGLAWPTNLSLPIPIARLKQDYYDGSRLSAPVKPKHIVDYFRMFLGYVYNFPVCVRPFSVLIWAIELDAAPSNRVKTSCSVAACPVVKLWEPASPCL